MTDYAKQFKIAFALICLLLALGYPIMKDFILDYFEYDQYETSSINRTVNDTTSFECQIIRSWNEFIHLPKRNSEKNFRIAIGLNTNVDLIVSGVKLMKELNLPASASIDGKNRHVINNLVEFKECFKYFFRKGSAAERSISDLNAFNQILKATEQLDNKQWFIGGNAALMAEGISNRFENTEIMLAGPVGPKLKELLNSKIQVSAQSQIDKDEIHLILEYNCNESLDNIKTKTANRFIVSHDIFNSRMEMLDNFFSSIRSFRPELVVLSGLHLIESQSNEFRQTKLTQLKSLLETDIAKEQAVHLELASIGDESLMKSITNMKILEQVNSLGLNEQELMFLAYSSDEQSQAPHREYYQDMSGPPDALKVIDVLEWTLRTYGRSDDINKQSKLTRVHFHCLMYHIIAIVEPSEWSNTESALMSGSKIAAKQACGFDFNSKGNENELAKLVEFRLVDKLVDSTTMQLEISSNQFIRLNSSYPLAEFKRGNVKFYFTPVLVCKTPLKTVGLGDAISSNGLFYSLFDSDFNRINNDNL